MLTSRHRIQRVRHSFTTRFDVANTAKSVPFEVAKLQVPTNLMPWPSGRDERVSVNSFGIGGANAHVRSLLPQYTKTCVSYL